MADTKRDAPRRVDLSKQYRHFAGLLAVIVDENHRATLLELIAEQQAKLADLHVRRLPRTDGEEHRRNWEKPHAKPRNDH